MSSSHDQLPGGGEVPADQASAPAGGNSPGSDAAGAPAITTAEALGARPGAELLLEVVEDWHRSTPTDRHQGPPPLTTVPAHFLANFDHFANRYRGDVVVMPAPMAGRLPRPPDPRSAEVWYRGYMQVDRNDRRARFRYLEGALTTWLQGMVDAFWVELRNGLAIALMADEGLWKEFLDANDRRVYRSANHFIKTYLHMWGLGESDTRVSRLRSGARLWVKIEGHQIPVPDSLSRLEHLSARKDGLQIYRALVREGGNQVPSDAAIKARVALVDGRVRAAKRASHSQKELGKLVAALARLVIEEDGRDMPAIKETTKELLAGYGPNEPRPPKPKKDRLPPWDSKLPCPCRLEETAKEGGVIFAVHVIGLPTAFADALLREAGRHRWTVVESGAGGRILTHSRHGANAAELNAWRHYVNHWACWVCRLFGAPAPRPQDMLVTPSQATGAA